MDGVNKHVLACYMDAGAPTIYACLSKNLLMCQSGHNWK